MIFGKKYIFIIYNNFVYNNIMNDLFENDLFENDIDNKNDKIRLIKDIYEDVLNILNIDQTNLDELDNDIESIKKDIDLKKEKILINQSNDKHSAYKIELLGKYIEHLDRHRKYIKKMIEGQNREKGFELFQERLQKQQQQQQKLVDNKIEQCDNHERFYNEVESLYNYLKDKYDRNGNHKSIMKALDIKNGDEIIIRAKTTDNGAVIKNTVTINKESTKQLKSSSKSSTGNEGFNVDDFDDDFNGDDDDDDDDDSKSSSETIDSGNKKQYYDDNTISLEENSVNHYIDTIEQIYKLSYYIYNEIKNIDAVKLNKIQASGNTGKFTKKIYEIIQVFQSYILNIFLNIDEDEGNIIYHNIFNIIKTDFAKKLEKLDLINKRDRFLKDISKEISEYENNAMSDTFQNVLKKEQHFLLTIYNYCKYLHDIIKQYENKIDEKNIDLYISTNKKIIENVKKKIKQRDEGFDEGFDDLYKKIFSDRPKSAPSYTNSNITGSNNNLGSKDDTNIIPFLNVGRASDYYKNVNLQSLGGSNKKKYTIKRLPNKKYTISKKIKNARLNKTRNRNIRNKNKNKTRINKHI